MKKVIKFFLILIMLVPMVVRADVYEVNNTDIILDLDDSWQVFFRENIKDNKKLEELGVSYEYMFNFFNQNDNVFIDAITLTDSDYIELLVYKERVNDITNLSLYEKDELREYAKEVSESRGCDTSGIISLESNYNNETTNYIKCTRIDSGKYLYEYITVVNNDLYLLQFQKDNNYTDSDIEIADHAIKNIHFNVKRRVDKEDQVIKNFKSKDDSVLVHALLGALGGALIGGISASVIYFIKKKSNNNNNNDNSNNNDNNENNNS